MFFYLLNFDRLCLSLDLHVELKEPLGLIACPAGWTSLSLTMSASCAVSVIYKYSGLGTLNPYIVEEL